MLIGIDLLKEVIETVVMTGRLRGHAPVSLILIAQPETGKTSIVTQKKCKAIQVFSDVTGRGLVELCQMKPEVTHIVINDMVAVMSHKSTVNRYTQAMLNAITEEGIQALGMPGGIQVVNNGKRGVIACTTAELNRDGRAWWNKIGLNTRMLPFAYDHSNDLTVRIKALINEEAVNGHNAPKKKKESILHIPAQPVPVQLSAKHAKAISAIVDKKAFELGEKGYRRLKQFQSLACGHALWRKSKQKPVRVTDAEIEFLNRIYPYISYEKVTPL